MELDYSKIKKGDTVYVVSEDKRHTSSEYEAEVISAGGKYITIMRYGQKLQFNRETGILKDWSTWKIYPSQVEYDIYKASQDKILYVSRNIDSVMRRFMSFDEIDTIYNIVKRYEK